MARRYSSGLGWFLAALCGLSSVLLAADPAADAGAAQKIADRDRLSATAKQLRGQGKLPEAIAAGEKALAIDRELHPQPAEELAVSLAWLGEAELERENFSGAEKRFQEALAIRTAASGADHWKATDTRLAIERARLVAKLSPQARQDLRDAEQAHRDLVRLYLEKRYQAAVEPAEKCRDIRRRVLGAAHPDYAMSLSNLALLYESMGDYAQAEPLYRQVLEIRKQALGAAHPDYAKGLNNLATLYRAQGDYARAEPLYRQVVELRKKTLGAAHPGYATSVNNLAALYDSMGNYAQAEPLYRQALEIRKQALGETHPDFAASVNNLAQLYRTMGDYARAEPLYRQALAIRKQVLGETHPDYAGSLNNLAALYRSMGDYARAEALYRQALQIRKQVLGEADPQYAQSLNDLGELYQSQDDWVRAVALFWQASKIRKKALGENHPDYIGSLNNLALSYDSMGNYTWAEPLYRQVLEIDKRRLGENHPDYATDLNNLAALYRNMGDYARAEPLYRQALEINKKALGETHPDYALVLNNLGVLKLAMGQPAEAEKLLRQVATIERKSLDLTAAVQSEQQQLAMTRKCRSYLDNYLSAAVAAGLEPAEVYAEVAAWKGSISAQQLLLRARQRALAGDPDSQLGRLFARIDADTRRLAGLIRVTPKAGEEEKLRQQRAELTESVNVLQQQLSRLDPNFHRLWAERKISPAQLCQTLPADAALVDLLEYNHYLPPAEKGKKESWQKRVMAFVLRRDQPVACVELGASDVIQQLVAAWRAGFGTLPAADGKQPGPELRRLVWLPLEKHLADVPTVLISPDGSLAQLPWGALPGETAGKYLIEERALAVIPMPQMLPELLKAPAQSGPPASLLLVGDIDYGGDPGAPTALAARSAIARRSGQLEFKRLDSAQAELASIRDWYELSGSTGKIDILRRRQATEAAFRDQAPKSPWLHVITHGFFAAANPLLPPAVARSADSNAALAGIGAALEIKGGHCLVTKLLPGLAADKDGRLKPGDEIVAVAAAAGDWTPVDGKSLTEIVAVIRGPIGTPAHIRVRPRDKPDGKLELSLVRVALPAAAPAPASSEAVDPGLLSGLAFSGANSPPAEGKDDGILTALEVSALDLSKVDTVVLSACETGLGQSAGGEGLLGLQRAFQVGGARTVVASLWKVPDAATGRLMQRYYENMWDRKLGKLAALREAQIFMLSDRGNRGLATEDSQPAGEGLPPYYWAAFVLSGDWR